MRKEWPTAGVGEKTGKQGVMEEETEEVSQGRSVASAMEASPYPLHMSGVQVMWLQSRIRVLK